MHLIGPDERRRTVAEVRRRLVPGAPFVVVQLSFPQRDATERALWLARHAANLAASGISAAQAESAIAMIGREVPALTPDEDQSILQEAGFTDVTEFFSAFTSWLGRLRVTLRNIRR